MCLFVKGFGEVGSGRIEHEQIKVDMSIEVPHVSLLIVPVAEY